MVLDQREASAAKLGSDGKAEIKGRQKPFLCFDPLRIQVGDHIPLLRRWPPGRRDLLSQAEHPSSPWVVPIVAVGVVRAD